MEIEEIHRRAKAGPLALLSRRAFAVAVSVVNAALLPHLLSPREFGLSAMAALVISLAEMFKDFGLTSALMRKGEVSPEEVNFLFWFNLATTLALTLAMAASAPLVGVFFREPAVTMVILVSLIGFAAGGISLQHRGLLTRDLRFGQVALIDSFSLLVQFVVTLALALVRHDVWAIVVGAIAGNLAGSGATIAASRWRPGRPRLIAEAGEILRFGANTSIYSLSIFVSNNVTPLLIGRLLGTADLGQFNRTNAVLAIPLRNAVQPIAQATMPVLGRLRPHPEHYRSAYLSLLTRLNLLVLPMAVMLALCGPVAVAAVWGPRWAPAGDLLQVLSPSAAVLGFGYAVGDLFVTQNRSRDLRTLGLLEMFLRVTAVGVGIRFSAWWACFGYSAATTIVVVVRIVVAGRTGPVSASDHLRTMAPGIAVAAGVAAGCGLGLVAGGALALGPGAAAPLAIAGGGAFGLASGLLWPPSRTALREIVQMLRPGRNGM